MGGVLQQLEAFSGLMARCLGSGMQPARALELCGSRSAWRRLRKWSDEARAQISEGDSLGDAVQASESPFPRFYTGTVRCGEQAGRLSEAFDDLAEHCRRLLPIANGVRELWLYPAIIFSFGWLVRAAMLAWFGQGHRIGHMILREIMPCVLVVLAVYVLRRWRPMCRAWYGLKLNMPVLREVELAWATNLFFRNLSLTSGMGGTSVVRMLTMACDGIANDVIRADFMRARGLLAEGQSWEDALGRCRLLTPQYREAVAVGEHSGNLPEALADVARTAGDELVFRLGILNRIIQRLMVLAVYVAIIVTALTLFGAALRQT